ncbi:MULTISPECIES: glycosyltransferase [Pseudomonas]|uniref:glycosyltransferase n=1 Tax=Pseudomonas TaxID=286 RepID=UPI00235F565E|nr:MULTISPECIES: glycosyltransferase [Pseudomonas]
MFELDCYGYTRDEQTGVWVRSDYQGIAYSDGDVTENKLSAIIRDAEDVSVLSEELPQHCTDWATLYHLSPTRGNILRPFEHLLKGKILEIGAGCGAISRFLGESGAQLLSLEGSPRRAAIAASRTRGLKNVTVLAERFDDFKTDEQFDAITLIGVLEYASMFSADDDPAYAMLKRIRSLLKPDGHLFIAIENQLGLKYFAGAPEDHLSVPMYGIEGRYVPGQPKTFGRKELIRLIERAGFKSSTFLSPSPDYKLPNSIITEAGFTSNEFDAAALAWQNVKKDPQLPEITHFNLEKAWPVVIDNDLGMDLANSFLVTASCAGTTPIAETTLAYHYSTGRKAAYCKESLFVKTDQGIEVQYRRLGNETPTEQDKTFKYVLPATDIYAKGKILSLGFLEIATTTDWTVSSFSLFITSYLKYLKILLAKEGFDHDLEKVTDLLPGRYIDAVPHNIVINDQDNPSLIDVEWEMSEGVELGHLLMRALLLLLACANPLSTSASTLSRQAFIIRLLESVNLHITPEDLDRYITKEARFQEKVTGRNINNFLDWSPDKTIYTFGTSQLKQPRATLYYSDASDTFSEQKTISQEVKNGTQKIVFSLAKIALGSSVIRLDPIDTRQSFSINQMKIAHGTQTVWLWQGEHESHSGVIKFKRTDKSVLYLSITSDPYLILPVDLKTLESLEQLTLEIDLTLLMDEQIVQEIAMLSETSSKELAAELTKPLEQQLEAVSVKYAELQQSTQKQLELLTQKNVELEKQQASSISEDVFKEKILHIQTLESKLTLQQVQKDTHIHNLNLQIIAMQSSSSWKLTAPLRKSILIMRRLRKMLRLLPSVIRRGGGIQNTAKKTLAVWKLQGTAGLIARLRWLNGSSDFAFVGQETREVPDRHDYTRWVEYYDTIDDNGRWRISEEIRKYAHKPLISIVMPVYNPPIDLLREAVDSVKSQLYPNWQLCLADDASTQPEVLEYLKSLAKDDKRIKVVFRQENGHISRASNSALEVATGQYVALMDNDDLLPEHALYWVARTIIENPDVGLIYSDEDKIDADGKRSSPYFKSDWNEFLFRSQNMICHLGVYRRDLMDKVGQFRPGFEGAQDYDLALRCIEQLEREQIIHIPRVLYHWRIHAGSTAMAGDEKPYAALAGVKALDEHLQRKGNIGKTELLPMGMYRVRYQLPEQLPMVSLIIPTRNAHSLVKQCIDSIKTLTTYPSYEIILIDNGSDDPESLKYFTEIDREDNIRVVRDDGPFNYSALNNGAVRQARGELIGLINNDIEIITPEWLDEMVSIALQPNVGAVGARLWYPDDRLQHGGVIVGIGGVAGHSHKYLPKGDYGYFCRAALTQELSAVTAACLIIKKSIFDKVNGLDEENLKIAFNDVDFCLRVQEAGYINVWTPFAEMYHHESATRGLEDTPEKKERFMKEVTYIQARWPEIQNDYAYNPNLTLDHEDFGLAWPPRVKI